MLVFQPMPLGRKPLPFDDPAYLFELKFIRANQEQLTRKGSAPRITALDITLAESTAPLKGDDLTEQEQININTYKAKHGLK